MPCNRDNSDKAAMGRVIANHRPDLSSIGFGKDIAGSSRDILLVKEPKGDAVKEPKGDAVIYLSIDTFLRRGTFRPCHV